jgi:hypothetical protein
MSRLQTLAVLKRTLLALAMLVSAVAPGAATVVDAQSLHPVVTFTPSSVAAGGSIFVSGNNFACPTYANTVTIDLDDLEGGFVATLGSVQQVCTKFANQQFTIPDTTTPGQYHIRGTDSQQRTALSTGVLTVNPNGLAISGTAECPNPNGQGLLPLPYANVDLFSGSALVASTIADNYAHYTINGAASGTVYQLRYTSNSDEPPVITCGTVADTTDGVNIPDPSTCAAQSWDTAAPLDPTGVASVDRICEANGSIWRRLSIQPGQQVGIVVGGLGPHTRVALFKDLRQDLQTLLANPGAPDLRQLDANMGGMAGSPWASSPWASSPWASSPWASSPWASSPWASSPWASSPLDTTQLCANLKLNVSGDTCAGAYLNVQIQDLIAWSADGQITKNTWDLSGDFYVRVYNDDASFDTSQPISVSATVDGTCGSPPQTTKASALAKARSSFLSSPSQTSLPGGKKTLILTDTHRLVGPNGLPLDDGSNSAALASFRTTVNTFAQMSNVQGVVVDFAGDAGLNAGFAQWDTPPFPSCPAAANVVSSAIHDLINAYRVQSGSAFQYVTILGGHTVIPYHLTPDTAELENENAYNPGLVDVSKSAGSLGSSFVMTDNYYVSFSPINHVESQISLPDANMAIGRLVEFPSDITSVLQDFIDNQGVARPTSALVTGYTFFTDLANFEVGQLRSAGMTTDSLISDTWTAPDLRAKLFGAATPGIVAINWHARSNEAVAADYSTTHPTTISSSEIANLPASDTRFKNALVISIGCHLAYPLLDGDVISNPTNPPQFVTDARAFTETFQSRGAMVLGNSGFGYGDTDFVGYSEQLLTLVTQELTDGAPSAVPMGIALTNAKRKYIQNSGATTGVDKKTLEEMTFYGPPMWSVGLPSRVAKPTPNTLNTNPATADSGHLLSAGTVSPPYTLTPHTLQPNNTSYFEADHAATDQAGGKQVIPYVADLPFKAFDVSSPSAGTARGVALIAADYVDHPNTTATVDVPVTEVSGSRPPWPTPGFWPSQTYGLNETVGQELVTTPIQWQSNDGLTGTTRQYASSAATKLRVYYSNLTTGAAFAGPAAITDVSLSPASNPALLHVDLTVTGATSSDVFDVLVNYTVPPAPGGTGHWKTCSLISSRTDGATTTASCPNAFFLASAAAPGSFVRHYQGDIDPSSFGSANPADLRLGVQAVTGAGLVTTRNNDGKYFQLVPQTATIGNPKATTHISIATPGALTYGLNGTFTASLASDDPSCSAAGQSLIFNLGSQVQTATTDAGGSASVTFNVQELPSAYPLTVAFSETTACLGSFQSLNHQNVNKQPTTLAFGATPYLARLSDANGTPMRERFVYFNFSGTSTSGTAVNASRAAQTDANGVAELRGMTVPNGTYTVKISFPGTIPTASGGTIHLSDPYYLPSSAQTQVAADLKAPTCLLNGLVYNSAGVATALKVTVQDTGSGIASVNPVSLKNGTFNLTSPTSYSAGITQPILITVNKTDLTQGTQVTLQVVDVAGNVTTCDPEIIQVGRTDELSRRERTTIAASEDTATVYNGTPGLQSLQIKVNSKSVVVSDLQPGEVRTVDLSDLMGKRKDEDRVVVTGQGQKGGSATVMFSDESLDTP